MFERGNRDGGQGETEGGIKIKNKNSPIIPADQQSQSAPMRALISIPLLYQVLNSVKLQFIIFKKFLILPSKPVLGK